ncbi:hypothetical protein [Urechidicola croceus]|uniref:Sugar-binding protein n=1 Tax=Urechidicola croceus TaxID=1850246 RepID=A0A1D8P875_9FLAO|nr:hypothetical protein [Urechidicola croceus]AOW20773.1 hypothetical protein LPB138_08825 [Urechidicola croceus]
MKKILFISTLFLLFTNLLLAQNPNDDPNRFFYSPYIEHYTNVIPETPNASNFTQYGNVPVDYSTGVPNISIPLYTLSVDGVEIPISISYHAGGVKVDDLASSVGLKWTLNAGGGIFRSIAGGKADEEGWINPLTSFLDYDWYQYPERDTKTIQDYLKQNGSNHDHDPDIFNYSFPGASGKFIFRPKTTLSNLSILKEREDKISIFPTIIHNPPSGPVFDSFTTKDHNGNQYNFGTKESNNNINITTSLDGIGQINFNSTYSLIRKTTAWMLNNITTKNNKTINFTYSPYEFEYQINAIGQRISIRQEIDPQNQGLPDVAPAPLNCDQVYIGNKFLKESTSVIYRPKNQLIQKIYSDNIEIQFVYSNNDSLSDWKKQLDKIVIKDKIENKSKEFRFVYETFNGDPRLQLKEVYEVGFDNQRKPSYIFSYNETLTLPPKGSFSKDYWGFYNGQNNGSLIPNTNSANIHLENPFLSQLADREVYTNYAKVGVLNKIQYPTGGATEFVYESNSDGLNLQGGLRIKEVKDLDGEGNTYNHTFYTYENYNGLLWREDLTYRPLGATYIYSSDFVLTDPSLHKQGYYYGKVIVKQKKAEGDFLTTEYFFEDNTTLSNFASLPKKTLLFKNDNVIQLKEFKYYKTVLEEMHWRQLGDRDLCYNDAHEGQLSPNNLMGYGEPINTYFRNYKHELINEITTNYNEVPVYQSGIFTVNEYKPSTTIKSYQYNGDMLVTRETIDTRYNEYISNHGSTPENFDEKGELFWIENTYPKDYPSDANLQDLITSKNLIALPISKTVINKGQQIQGQFFTYDSNGNIKETYLFNKGTGTNNSNSSYIPEDYDLSTTYSNIDGKPTEVKHKDGTTTSYIWGYNKQYPVAKIDNATYAQIEALQYFGTNFNFGVGGLSINQENSLRNNLSNSMITTYTYDPLIGVKTMTDPRNRTVYYFYDGFGRLEYVKDHEGNILSENEYNYKN